MNDRSKRHLYHGGHKGTEAAFGEAAEAWNIPETTISFEGHKMVRANNVEVLSDAKLAEGRVSMEFVFQALGRRFAEGQEIRRVIQSMFQLVVRSDELFAVGWIQDDSHVRGGTGWGVELAKLFNRPVHVYDQGKEGWFTWSHGWWQPSEPVLPQGSFAATGTRHLAPVGKQAIHDLFERSVGTEATHEVVAGAGGLRT